jgi:cytochrome b6-f complex subunit 4
MPDLEQPSSDETIPFYPDHFRTELRVVFWITIIIAVIGVIGYLMPVGIGDPADPMDTPAHVKPEWYFLAIYQILKFIPKTIGALLPVVLILLITIMPFLDRKPDRSASIYRKRLISVVIGLIVLTVLTIWGEVS